MASSQDTGVELGLGHLPGHPQLFLGSTCSLYIMRSTLWGSCCVENSLCGSAHSEYSGNLSPLFLFRAREHFTRMCLSPDDALSTWYGWAPAAGVQELCRNGGGGDGVSLGWE